MTDNKGSTLSLCNPRYIDQWLSIWEALNGEEEIILSEKERDQFIKDLLSTSIKDRQITSELVLNDDITEIEYRLNTVREFKNKKLLSIKEIIETVKDMLKINTSSPEQIRKHAEESTWILDNPDGRFNHHEEGEAGSVNAFIIEPDGYIDHWLSIWKALNGGGGITLSEIERKQFIKDLRSTPIEYRQITSELVLNGDITEIGECLNTIRQFKNKKLLSIKEIIGTVKAMLKIKTSSPAQLRRTAKVEPIILSHSDIIPGKYYHYGKGFELNKVMVLKIYYDNSMPCETFGPYYDIEFTDSTVRQTTIDQLSDI